MNKRIFWAIFSTALLTFFLGIFLFAYFLEYELDKKLLQNMQKEAKFIKQNLTENHNNFDDLITNNRITIIKSSGEVIFDNKVQANILDNHFDREEILLATKKGSGFSSRYSKTLKTKTIYYATKLNDNTILRIANHQDSLTKILFDIIYYLIGVVLLILLFSFMLSSYLSKLIIKPLNLFNFNQPYASKIYDEFLPFISKITQQESIIKEKNQTLKNKQLELDSITQNMQECFVIIDKSFKIIAFNKSADKLFGPIKLNTSIFTINRKKEIKEAITQALKGNKSELILKFNNAYYQILTSSIYEDGNIMGAMVFILDVTQKQENENLRKEFSANVSHELKTPLTSISGYAELIKNNLVATADIQKFGDKIYHQAQHLLNLINDIIKISKLDENNLNDTKEILELKPLILEILTHLDSKDIDIQVKGEAKIFGVKSLIEDLIFNLCDNAIKYNKPQGQIFITLHQDKNQGSLTIKDTGIGISLHNQQRVFERFFREDKSHSQTIPGTGLGLSIVKHIIAFHKFNLTLESIPQQGTTFHITWNFNISQ